MPSIKQHIFQYTTKEEVLKAFEEAYALGDIDKCKDMALQYPQYKQAMDLLALKNSLYIVTKDEQE